MLTQPAESWECAKQVLDEIEVKLAGILSKHSVFYWHHLYRRTGVYLNRPDGEQRDPTTVLLTREIVELAIQRYGKLTAIKDFGYITEHPIDDVLGGWMVKGALDFKKENDWFNIDQFLNGHKELHQVILLTFDENDFNNLFRAQAYAYEYWKVTALLRAIGKGAGIELLADGHLKHHVPNDFWWLINSFDQRNEVIKPSSDIKGNWMFSSDEKHFDSSTDLTLPVMNASRKLSEKFGIATNFNLSGYSTEQFLTATSTVTDRAEKELGFSLENLMSVLWALSLLKIATSGYQASSKHEAKTICLAAEFNLAQRGYSVFRGTVETLANTLKAHASQAERKNFPELEILVRILKYLTLTKRNQKHTSLWSRGPVKILKPTTDGFLIDTAQILPLLLNIGAMWRLNTQENRVRGSFFEATFRDALKTLGCNVFHKDIFHADFGNGKEAVGEIDAAVSFDSVLYLFECYSSETPLDLKISKPQKLKQRIEGSSEKKFKDGLKYKLDQALGIAEFLNNNKVGMNYDFSEVTQIIPIVVSPFVEWIWEKSDKLWIDDDTPRIMAADEALNFIKELKA